MVGLGSLPGDGQRRVDQHPQELDFRWELAEQRVMFGLGVDRTDADHDISIGAHPLGRSPAGAERCSLMTWTPAREAGVRVVKEREDGIVRQVLLFDDGGAEVVIVNRFLSHLTDAGYSPNTVCAYAYDLRHLARFLAEQGLDWDDFRRATALEFLGYLRRVPSQRPAQRLGLTVATEQGRLLSAATVQRVLAATSSFFDWAIAAEQYVPGENPMQRRDDQALGRVPDRHRPFVGAASHLQSVRRTVRVRLPLRLPRPMREEDVEALLASLTTMRDLAIVLMMLDGGLRSGEVLCLQLGDIAYGPATRRRRERRNGSPTLRPGAGTHQL